MLVKGKNGEQRCEEEPGPGGGLTSSVGGQRCTQVSSVPKTWIHWIILPKKKGYWRGGEGGPCLSLRAIKPRQDDQH